MKIFTVHLEGPVMGLQGPRVDAFPQGLEIPTRSMMTGLLGAALGVDRGDTDVLQRLQDTMTIAVAIRRIGVELTDYQTGDLGKAFLRGPMWWHQPETGDLGVVERKGAAATREGRRPQHRRYRSDAKMTVLIQLTSDSPYTPDAVLEALDKPARPLGLGRMSCPPTARIGGRVVEVDDLVTAAREVEAELLYIPAELADPEWGDLFYSVAGTRNWHTGQHTGTDTYLQRPAA